MSIVLLGSLVLLPIPAAARPPGPRARLPPASAHLHRLEVVSRFWRVLRTPIYFIWVNFIFKIKVTMKMPIKIKLNGKVAIFFDSDWDSDLGSTCDQTFVFYSF